MIPLSPYSKIFFYEWKIDPSRYDYNIVFRQKFKNRIEVDNLQSALNRFVIEHVLFNSHVSEISGELFWKQNKQIESIRYFTKAISEEDIVSIIKEPFDIENGPLYKFILITNANNSELIIVLHHLIIDGTGIKYFYEEFSNYYNDNSYRNKFSTKDQIVEISNISKKLSNDIERNNKKSKKFWKSQLLNISLIDFSIFLKKSRCSYNQQDKKELSFEQISKVGEIRFCFEEDILLKLNKIRSQIISPYFYGRTIYALIIHKYTQQVLCARYFRPLNKELRQAY